MSNLKFSADFKRDAVEQIIGRGYAVGDVSKRLGVSKHSLYDWVKRSQNVTSDPIVGQSNAEIRRLKAELVRVTEERDILKKAAVYFAKEAK